MKPFLPLAGLLLIGAGLVDGAPGDEVTVIISGGARGHLSPCGCTKPMTGGFKRLATVVRQYKAHGDVVWLDTGDIIDTPGRQSQLKVETYAELMSDLGVDAVAYTNQDRTQGIGLLTAGTSLSRKKWLSSSSDNPNYTIEKASLGGLSVTMADGNSLAFETEKDSDLLVFDGPQSQANQAHKEHQVRIYASDGIPTVNGADLSPGSNLRGVVVATFRGGRFVSAKTVLLEPSVTDDPKADSIYRYYLKRVTQEKLIDKVPRESTDDFAGSKNCRSCHGKIYDQYLKTRHAVAYQSLVHQGHQADPDCVGCHVVGLNSVKGFWFDKTPALAQVGCESCHGSGREHARNPKLFRLPKVESNKCISCHTPSNSPTFDFASYWKKIKH